MIGERKLYNGMKAVNISTLEVHRILEKLEIEIPKRTLQSYLDNDFSTCKDDRIEKIIKKMIANRAKLLVDLTKQFVR